MLGLHSYIERRRAGCCLLIGYEYGSFKFIAMLPYTFFIFELNAVPIKNC